MSRHIRLALLLVCVLSLAAGRAFADIDPTDLARPAFRVFNDKDGMPQNSVLAMSIDRRGNFWIGTQDGAAFYNGRVWQVVNMPNRSISNYVSAVLAAADGSIWFGTYEGGVSRLKDGQWTTYTSASGLPHNSVNTLLETMAADGAAAIWAGTEGGGLAVFKNGRWSVIDGRAGLPGNVVNCLLAADNGVYAGTSTGIAHIKASGAQWRVATVGLFDNPVRALLETASDNGGRILWAGTDGSGLQRNENGRWSAFGSAAGLPDTWVSSLNETTLRDGTRALWVGTRRGLARWQRGRWSHFTTADGLPINKIMSLKAATFGDGVRTLWVGTHGGGLARLELGRWLTFNEKNGLPGNEVWSFLETAGATGSVYWVATINGLARLEAGRWTTINARSGLPESEVRSLLETTADNGGKVLWVGTRGGLARLEGGRWTIFDKRSGLPSNTVISLLEVQGADGVRTLWAGTDGGGLARLENDRWTVIDTASVLPNNWVSSLVETSGAAGQRTLWIGTGGGLVKFESGNWTTIDMRAGLPNNTISSLLVTERNGVRTLWVGTYGGVALRPLNDDNAHWQVLSDTTDPALPNNVINQMREDREHRVYLFTNKGIARLTRRVQEAGGSAPFEIYTFTTEDGLPSNECVQGSAMVDSRGRIWAGMVGGATIFNPDVEIIDRAPKQLHIERALLAGGGRALAANEVLAYNQNNISFEYSLASLFREADTRFRTQLVGLDESPSEWSANFRRDYTNLPEGNFTFTVWGRDYAGNVSGPQTLSFIIRPAPWRSWWAYFFYVVTFVGVGYGGLQLRLSALNRRNRVLESKVAMRTAQLDKKNEELAEKVAELARKNEELIRSKEELEESYKQAEKIFCALSDVLPGSVLDDKYRLDEKIGTGGFGAVYRAYHLGLNKPVAVKIFRPSSGNAYEESLERFRLEGVSSCRVNHPNAVMVLDSGVSGGISYLVMELLNGCTLTDELAKKKVLSPQRCAEIIIPVCDVLSKAHAAGIIHRDIKPDNIFLHQGEEGEVIKVLDFGIAKLMGDTSSLGINDITQTGGLIGTPTYMSPERLNDMEYDGRADVYSVGIMLYQMLCGRVPFYSEEAGGFGAVVVMHMTKAPPPLREKNPKLSAEIERVVLRALEKEPQRRPTAKELMQEFALAVGMQPSVWTSGGFKLIISGEENIANEKTLTFEPNKEINHRDTESY